MVCPDCRRFIKHHKEILADIGNAVEAHGWSAAEFRDLVARHCAVIEHLDVVGHYTRAVWTLTPSEIDELARACAKFGEAWRASYPHRKEMTVKGHIVEVHVPEFARKFGTCGVFGEDGLEALHPHDTLVRRLVRQMRNPEARHAAHTLHLEGKRSTPELDREKKKGQREGEAAGMFLEAGIIDLARARGCEQQLRS